MPDGLPKTAAAVGRDWRIRSVVIAAAVVLAGYAGSAFASRAVRAEWGNKPEPYEMTYLGHPLHCLVVEDGSVAGRIGGVTCDFVRYWRARR